METSNQKTESVSPSQHNHMLEIKEFNLGQDKKQENQDKQDKKEVQEPMQSNLH